MRPARSATDTPTATPVDTNVILSDMLVRQNERMKGLNKITIST